MHMVTPGGLCSCDARALELEDRLALTGHSHKLGSVVPRVWVTYHRP